jgi:hypothetical protein
MLPEWKSNPEDEVKKIVEAPAVEAKVSATSTRPRPRPRPDARSPLIYSA